MKTPLTNQLRETAEVLLAVSALFARRCDDENVVLLGEDVTVWEFLRRPGGPTRSSARLYRHPNSGGRVHLSRSSGNDGSTSIVEIGFEDF